MACTKLSTARGLNCSRGIGGVQTVYMAHTEDIASYTLDGSGVVNAITMVSSSKFYEFKMEKETALFTNPPIGNVANGAQYFDEVLTLVFNKPEASTLNQISILAKANVTAIVKTNNGDFRFLGSQNDGLVLNGGDGGSGTATTDRNGYSLQFRGYASTPAPFVSSSLVTGSLVTFA